MKKMQPLAVSRAAMPALVLPVLAAVVLLATAMPAAAAGDPEGAARMRTETAALQQELYRGSRIIGSAVRDTQDRRIGEIKDLLLDSARGEVAYAVVDFGSTPKRKLHPVPWRALAPGEDGKHYVLHADREVVGQAPGFDNARWPDMGDQRWSEEIDRYWNRAVGRGPFADQPLTSGNPAGAATSGAGAAPGSSDAGRPPERRQGK